MNKKNTEKLYKDFPKLYAGRKKSLKESLMAFGFGCADGWFGLIYKLSQKIATLDPKGEVQAVQVKEKFAGLRFYINWGNREVFDLIDEAEKKSLETCEECGKPGKPRNDIGWWQTLCERHYTMKKKL